VEHKLAKCDPECLGCAACINGVEFCETCGSLSNALAAECPGERLDGDQLDALYYGLAQYVSGRWLVKIDLTCPARYTKDELQSEWRSWDKDERAYYKEWLEFARYSEKEELEAASYAAHMVRVKRRNSAWLPDVTVPCKEHKPSIVYCGRCGFLREEAENEGNQSQRAAVDLGRDPSGPGDGNDHPLP
jgi:hypothetical protein